MLKMTASVLSAVLLVAAVGVTAADAKGKKKAKAKKAEVASCTASPIMRDESRMTTCWPNYKK